MSTLRCNVVSLIVRMYCAAVCSKFWYRRVPNFIFPDGTRKFCLRPKSLKRFRKSGCIINYQLPKQNKMSGIPGGGKNEKIQTPVVKRKYQFSGPIICSHTVSRCEPIIESGTHRPGSCSSSNQ